MRFSKYAFIVIYLLFLQMVPSCSTDFHGVYAAECGIGKRPLFFAVDPRLRKFVPREFASELLGELDQPLQEIGYCITRYSSKVMKDSLLQDELIMMLSLNVDITEKTLPRSIDDSVDDDTYTFLFKSVDTVLQVIVSTISIKNWGALERRKALANPLLSLEYRPDEVSTFKSVLIKKIVENLRLQYICHLRIESMPVGVHIRSVHGLEGITPLEWVTPLGRLPIRGVLEGYEPISRKIDLFTPGNHTYVLQMQRRRFYHSRFFVPSVACAAGSAGSFLLMYYFDRKYDELGREDKQNNPERFKKTYNTAVACEAAGFTLLTCAIGSFSLCFLF